jgi:hypothetical protein
MDAVKSIFALWPEVKYTEIDSGCVGWPDHLDMRSGILMSRSKWLSGY